MSTVVPVLSRQNHVDELQEFHSRPHTAQKLIGDRSSILEYLYKICFLLILNLVTKFEITRFCEDVLVVLN